MKNSDTLLVGFDNKHGDIAVLIVGRKEPGEKVQIINQFQGKEAEEERFHKLLYAIFDICELADFEIEGRIVLVDKRSGKVWR